MKFYALIRGICQAMSCQLLSVERSVLLFLRFTLTCAGGTPRDSKRKGRGRTDSTFRGDKLDPAEVW